MYMISKKNNGKTAFKGNNAVNTQLSEKRWILILSVLKHRIMRGLIMVRYVIFKPRYYKTLDEARKNCGWGERVYYTYPKGWYVRKKHSYGLYFWKK